MRACDCVRASVCVRVHVGVGRVWPHTCKYLRLRVRVPSTVGIAFSSLGGTPMALLEYLVAFGSEREATRTS